MGEHTGFDFRPPELSAPQVNPGRFHRFGHVAGLQVSKGPWEQPVVSGQALAPEIHSTRWGRPGFTGVKGRKAKVTRPESEKGDCQAIPSKEIVKIELPKSHDFFIQSVIE